MTLFVCNRCGERQDSAFSCGYCGWGDLWPVAKQTEHPAPTADAKAELREAQRKLRDSTCTCPGGSGHDPFWVKCERTKAEILVEEALAGLGVLP